MGSREGAERQGGNTVAQIAALMKPIDTASTTSGVARTAQHNRIMSLGVQSEARAKDDAELTRTGPNDKSNTSEHCRTEIAPSGG